MIAAEFIDQVQKLHIANHIGVEDFADKFNFLITVLILLMCTSIVTVKQYMMKPISCYMATDIGGKNLLDYLENYCWVQGTIPISYADNIPDTEEKWLDLNKEKILYYQWVPFVLGLQCILFYLPRIFWQMICYNNAGTDVEHIVTLASEAVRADEKKRQQIIDNLAKTLTNLLHHIHRKKNKAKSKRSIVASEINNVSQTFSHPRSPVDSEKKGQGDFGLMPENTNDEDKRRNIFSRFFRSLYFRVAYRLKYRNNAKWFTLVYIFIKVLYLLNAIGQLFLMQSFLGFPPSNIPFGIEVFNNILLGHDWEMTKVFPRVAYCLTPVRNIGSKRNFATAQCVLPVNMLNEKIYVFLWWWISLATCINCYSLLSWLCRTVSWQSNLRFIKKNLASTTVDHKDLVCFDEFVHKFLSYDGVFILKMVSKNAGDLTCSGIVISMWKHFLLMNDKNTI